MAATHRERGSSADAAPAQRGVPDGLLIGVLAFLLASTCLVWTATGLAGLLSHGAWPDGVEFTRTPAALRSLLSAPQDLPSAWPGTPPAQLSGWGLFWGLAIGQLLPPSLWRWPSPSPSPAARPPERTGWPATPTSLRAPLLPARRPPLSRLS